MSKTIIGTCLTCGQTFQATSGSRWRCAPCQDERSTYGKFGSLIVLAEGDDPTQPPKLPMTQREWASTKREFYNVTKTLSEIDSKKAAFIQEAMRAVDEMMAQVEQEMGAPLAELRGRQKQLQQLIQRYMVASGRTEQVIKDLLVEVKNEVVNQGNRPLWTQITDKMGDMLGWSKEQLKEFIRANHSLPQFADRLHVTKLPPGRRRQKQTPETSAFFSADRSLQKIASVEKIFLKTGSRVCELDTPDGKFFLTGRLVRENGLKAMVERQLALKDALSITDTERQGDAVRVTVEGSCAYDPNTVRAFLIDRFPNYRYADVFVVTDRKIALELAPTGGDNAQGVALEFFDYMMDTFATLLDAERSRGQIAMSLLGQVQGRNQGDLPSDVGDLSLARERSYPGRGGAGNEFGSGAQEGIMQPSGGAPYRSTN